MDFTETPRRARGESIVPMINVVFLLLIFFLMTSHLVQPEPFEVTPPTSSSTAEPTSEETLYVDASGRLHFDGAEDETIFAILSARSAEIAKIKLRADGQTEAQTVARILRQLAEAGLSDVELVIADQ